MDGRKTVLPLALICTIASLLFAMSGCTATHHPLTVQLLESGFSFDGLPEAEDEFDGYAGSPKYKAFAVSVNGDGVIHAWAKA